MLIDFHSHHPAPYSIICNADASMPDRSAALLKCAGLLPDLWTENLQQQLFDLLDAETDLQMGEVGLDRRFENILPMDRQIEIFRQELAFAISKGRSISIHCVRATKPMLDILKEMKGYFRRLDPEIILDREEAIRKAVSLADKGDTILLLGKGDDHFFIYPEGHRPYISDKTAVINAINELKNN